MPIEYIVHSDTSYETKEYISPLDKYPYVGRVKQNSEGTWDGILERKQNSLFLGRLNLPTRKAAISWINKSLRKRGIK